MVAEKDRTPPIVLGGGVENAFISPCHTPTLLEPRACSHLPAPGTQSYSGGSTFCCQVASVFFSMYLVLSLKLNSDLPLIFRSDAGLTVILPQSLSPDSSNQQSGACQEWEGGLCSSVLVIRAKGAHFPWGNIWLEFIWWTRKYSFLILWFLCFGITRNYVIFLMSTSSLPVMISCHCFPVSEEATAPLVAYLRKKKIKSAGEPLR